MMRGRTQAVEDIFIYLFIFVRLQIKKIPLIRGSNFNFVRLQSQTTHYENHGPVQYLVVLDYYCYQVRSSIFHTVES